jgi:ADP-L-glycero-D-manno-heptose 6-epimerase
MIVVTGAAGFIGSCLVGALNAEENPDLILVDEFSDPLKNRNLENKKYKLKIDRKEFISWFGTNAPQVSVVFHIGARTDTTEFNIALFNELNLEYSKSVWKLCAENNIPLIYASSAATYGLGENGYRDDESKLNLLKPLNPYGDSKNEFDKWAIVQEKKPPHWYGLKFFNVYGPNEYHKGRMASVIFHAFHQIMKNGNVKLFRSHHPDYKDGEQLRDFIYIKDLLNIMLFLYHEKPRSGIYNCGTGKARTFVDLTKAVFNALSKTEEIGYIDTPADIRDKYQYFTEADMQKLRNVGYVKEFTSLETGVSDYVRNFLVPARYY